MLNAIAPAAPSAPAIPVAQILADHGRTVIERETGTRYLPACGDGYADGCGAEAGEPCEAGCPSLATDEQHPHSAAAIINRVAGATS